MIDLVALRSLIALDAHGTVAAAATALGYTSSAVSQQVKRLEQQAGVALTERVGRRVVLTEQARLLVAEGREVLARVEALESALLAHGGELTGSLRLAAFSTGVRGLVAPLARALARSAPGLELTVTEEDPHGAVELVASGQVDLALAHTWVGVGLPVPSRVHAEHLGEDVAELLVHRDHPLAGRASTTPADLLEEVWASTPPGTICHEWFTLMFAPLRLPRVGFWSFEFESQVRLVQEGVAVALVPRLGRGPLPPEVVPVPVRDPVPTRTVRLLWRETMEASPSVRHVRDQLRRLVAAGDALLPA